MSSQLQMNSLKLSNLFKGYFAAVKNTQKIFSANTYLRTSKGTRLMRKARKYKRPEDLEDPYYYGVGPKPEVKAALQSLSDRGFAKELTSYQPPTDVEEQLHKICKRAFGPELQSDWKKQPLNDATLKYKVIVNCIDAFKKDVPNSSIHKMKTVEDLFEYYKTSVDGCLPYDALVRVRDNEKLPPNLQILSETPAFNPDSDTFFGGVTAYPGRKRIIYTKTGEKFEKIIEWPNI
ncbi:39S ribosomal protein L50, mitochondrial [Caerostris extrusa]|uniref:Large ribosomal subunit protein mL50 n=1 Tax=Caerostris extrusa TaxID=172846 RepID=A0AAV4UP15_CAEEX|nr:39S ribosomal protein L50, mitochondrial [Caerostris extrusa]